MSKFYIIHLSDLHITDERTITLSNLIKSLAGNQELESRNVFLIITGDIINRGEYGKYSNSAYSFFSDLHKALTRKNIKILDVHIVPGNHDKSNTPQNKLISIAQQSNIFFPLSESEQKSKSLSHIPLEREVLQLQSQAFNDYIALCNRIFEIFEIQTENGKTKQYNNTYGVDYNMLNDTCVSFIRMNTAFSCNGTPNDSEKYHLTIGATQYNELRKQYVTLRNDAESNQYSLLTFCLAHHPMLYLKPDESNMINKMLLAEDDFNVDYILTGHVHDAAISNLSDHNRNVINLETGIGWPDATGQSHKDHRYAIYGVDEERSIFWSMMYKTNRANKFEPDIDYLLTNDEKQNKKICSPLKRRDFAFIDVNTKGAIKDFLFVNDESMGDLKSLYKTITKFSTMCEKTLISYKYRYVDYLFKNSEQKQKAVLMLENNIEKLKKPDYKWDDFNKSYEKIFSLELGENDDVIKQLFKSYLQHITDFFVLYFNEYFEDDSETRAVFRVYSNESENCIPVCVAPPVIIPRICAETNQTGRPREYTYKGSLIEYSYNNKSSMIYSLNQEHHNFKSENWDDFITIIPSMNKDKKSSIPSLSFIYSVRLKSSDNDDYTKQEVRLKKKRQTNKLILLQFTNIEEVLSDAIKQFTKHFDIEINSDLTFLLQDFEEKLVERI